VNSSEEYQRLAWVHLEKRINGCVNKVNVTNVGKVVFDLLQENVVWGKWVLIFMPKPKGNSKPQYLNSGGCSPQQLFRP